MKIQLKLETDAWMTVNEVSWKYDCHNTCTNEVLWNSIFLKYCENTIFFTIFIGFNLLYLNLMRLQSDAIAFAFASAKLWTDLWNIQEMGAPKPVRQSKSTPFKNVELVSICILDICLPTSVCLSSNKNLVTKCTNVFLNHHIFSCIFSPACLCIYMARIYIKSILIYEHMLIYMCNRSEQISCTATASEWEGASTLLLRPLYMYMCVSI